MPSKVNAEIRTFSVGGGPLESDGVWAGEGCLDGAVRKASVPGRGTAGVSHAGVGTVFQTSPQWE